jgi:serine/threonine protein kinase
MEGQTIDFFVFDQLLGTGAFASVWRAHPVRSPVPVAIKVISKSHLTDTTRLTREISIMRQIIHPLFSRLFHVADDSTNYYIVQEYAPGGSLADRVSENGILSESQARHYFIQLICALEYLHNSQHVAHRDIKGENILLDGNNNIKVIDFGISRAFVNAEEHFNSAVGSPCFTAPELIRKQSYTSSVDIWSSGVVLFHMVSGQLPFLGSDVHSTFKLIAHAEPEFPRIMSDALVDLLRKMLNKDPEARIGIEGIKTHPWFSLNWFKGLVKFADATREDMQAPGLDPQVITKMEGDGIDCTGLPHAFLSREQNELTTLYAIYRRNRMNEQMGALVLSAQACDLWKYERRLSLQAGNAASSITVNRVTRPQIPFPSQCPGGGEKKMPRRVLAIPVVVTGLRKPSAGAVLALRR